MGTLSSRLRALVEGRGGRMETVTSHTRVKVSAFVLDPDEGWVADLSDEEIYDVHQGAIEQWPVDEDKIRDALERENVPEAKIKRMLDGKLGKRITLPGRDGLTVDVRHEEPKQPSDPADRMDWPPQSMRDKRRR
jgi:hypothetical protein